MKWLTSRRRFLALIASTLAGLLTPALAQLPRPADRKRGGKGGNRNRGADGYELPPELAAFERISLVLGRVTDRSVTVSALAREPMEVFFEYGTQSAGYDHKTGALTVAAGQPAETTFDRLKPDTRYYYRLNFRRPGEPVFQSRPECGFHTQRAPGSTFQFAVQGDSHPERPQMSDPALYARTLLAAASAQPDFYLCMGDDFSVAPVREVNAATVGERYTLQRPFLGLIAQSAPLFLLNGNHEQASLFNFNQAGVRHEVAVLAQNARNRYYPTPAPDSFYSGDTAPLKGIGLLKDYCAWTWGDALFVVLDNYWQSPVQVDSGFQEEGAGGGKNGPADRKQRDGWGLTLGDAQYQWFRRTLEQSRAKYKFVFAHHVLGTGRGGVEECDLYEWGGRNKRGEWEFDQKRPGWALPIHPLMVKHGVTIFFQGHDHLFCRQERDGLIYQEVPMPADPGYQTYNEDRYLSGVKLPNSGHLRVTVSPEKVTVEYVRSYLAKDETALRKTGEVAHSYSVQPRKTP